mmetsp:Transcript_28277/g.42762  ORF Transcript_28277/g.42762 Transcript_28277/m.42762 type:complete len:363 (+) Transcript_28277:81-1169(+)
MAALLRQFKTFEQPKPTIQMVVNAKDNMKKSWYIRGGMGLFEHGAILSEFVPAIVLQNLLFWRQISPISFLGCAFIGLQVIAFREGIVSGDGSIVASILVPLFHITFTLSVCLSKPLTCLAIAFLALLVKSGVCMSVVLHRWAAHGAFKCSFGMKIVLAILGCLATQGGPVWWASKHRCHHKFCDEARDPHSPKYRGLVGAFAWFGHEHKYVDLEFIPPHLKGDVFMLIDTFSFVPSLVEYIFAYYFFGQDGLWIAYMSSSFCKVGTLWFNVTNHPPEHETATGTTQKIKCTANDDPWQVAQPNVYFVLITYLMAPVADLIGERIHSDHHDHPRKSHRPGPDLCYWLFLLPLEKLGLIWDLL